MCVRYFTDEEDQSCISVAATVLCSDREHGRAVFLTIRWSRPLLRCRCPSLLPGSRRRRYSSTSFVFVVRPSVGCCVSVCCHLFVVACCCMDSNPFGFLPSRTTITTTFNNNNNTFL